MTWDSGFRIAYCGDGLVHLATYTAHMEWWTLCDKGITDVFYAAENSEVSCLACFVEGWQLQDDNPEARAVLRAISARARNADNQTS